MAIEPTADMVACPQSRRNTQQGSLPHENTTAISNHMEAEIKRLNNVWRREWNKQQPTTKH